MKDIYNPDNEDVMEWVNSSEEKWPASDWDYYVTSCDNDLLIMKLAKGYILLFIHTVFLVGCSTISTSETFSAEWQGTGAKLLLFHSNLD